MMVMTAERIAEIRTRLDAAPPGPWHWEAPHADTPYLPSPARDLLEHAPTDIGDLLAYVVELEGTIGRLLSQR
jgi:hypothetical protein